MRKRLAPYPPSLALVSLILPLLERHLAMTLFSKLVCVHVAIAAFAMFLAIEASAAHMGALPYLFLACAFFSMGESIRLLVLIEKGES